MGMVAKAGFYDGKFLKAGQTRPDKTEPGEPSAALGKMTKDELIAEADRLGVSLPAGATKPEILAALEAA